jgi:hypothetical protein
MTQPDAQDARIDHIIGGDEPKTTINYAVWFVNSR